MNTYLTIILGAVVSLSPSCGARPSLGGGGGGSNTDRPCVTDDDCDPGAPCAGHDVCIEQVCYPGPVVEQVDDKQCTNDFCDLTTGVVTHPPVDVDDGNACTVDGCAEGVGIWHTPTPSCGEDAGSGSGGSGSGGSGGAPPDLDAGCPPGPAPPLPDCGLPSGD